MLIIIWFRSLRVEYNTFVILCYYVDVDDIIYKRKILALVLLFNMSIMNNIIDL